MQQKVVNKQQGGQRLVGGVTGNGKQPTNRVANCTQQTGKATETPLIDTEEFRMFAYKVLECQKKYRHDWSACPYAHQGEKAKRRDPRRFQYVAMVCLDMKTTGQCARGDACPFCHNVFELWLHPARYRTQLCNNGATCDRKVCFFAHSLDQLRTTPGQFVNEKVEQFLGNSIMANPDVMKAIFSLEQNRDAPQIDREATAKLASLQQQLLGSEKLFTEILKYNKVDLDSTSTNTNPNTNSAVANFNPAAAMSKPSFGLGAGNAPNPMCAPSPASPLAPPNQQQPYFLSNNAASQMDPLQQLLAITQKPNRFSAESFNSPLDIQNSPQSPQHRSASDVLAQVNRDGGFCGTIPEVDGGLLCGANSSNLSGSTCFDGNGGVSNWGNDNSEAVAAATAMFRAKSMYAGSAAQQAPMDPASLQQFINALGVGNAATTVTAANVNANANMNKARTLMHQDSGSSYSSNNSYDRRNSNLLGVGVSSSGSFNGLDLSGVLPKYQNLMNCCSVSSGEVLPQMSEGGCCVGGMSRGMSANIQKLNTYPPLMNNNNNNVAPPVDEKKLLECVEYLHLFEEQGSNDAATDSPL